MDKIEIWRYFREKGDADKGRNITIATWLLSLATAILAYLVKNHYVFESIPFCIIKPVSAAIFSVFGIAVSIYTYFIVMHLRNQTYKNWVRAEYIYNQLGCNQSPKIENGDNKENLILCQSMNVTKDKFVGNVNTVIKLPEMDNYLKRYNPVTDGFPKIFTPFLRIALTLGIIFLSSIIYILISWVIR